MIDKNIYKEFEKNSKKYNSIFSIGVDFIHELFRINKNIFLKRFLKEFFFPRK